MAETLRFISEKFSFIYFVRQSLAVLALFLLGFIFVYSVLNRRNSEKKTKTVYNFLLAFPVGLSIYAILALLLLISGIKYTAFSICVVVIVFIVAIVLLVKPVIPLSGEKKDLKLMAIGGLTVICLIILSVSGVISVIFSNDSMYYYSAYPHEIARSGLLSYKYDTFLTDAGQGTAIINTIPFLFGFNESFGIHNFFNLNFICFFFYAIFEQASKYFDKRKTLLFAALGTGLLVSTLPFILISKWVIANVYFMEMMFICLYMNYEFCDDTTETLPVRTILLMMLSIIRIEGALFVGLVLFVYLMDRRSQKKTVITCSLAVALIQTLYFIKIYVTMNILAPYTFMSKEKAVIAVGFIIGIAVYSVFYAGDAKENIFNTKIFVLKPEIITYVVLLLVNGVLFLYDRALFISNVKAFAGNLLHTGGWGVFMAVMFMAAIMVPKVDIKDNYFDYFWTAFLLMAFAACFARGDELRMSLSDSGNRVMLQIVPFVVYAFIFRYIKAFSILQSGNKSEEDK